MKRLLIETGLLETRCALIEQGQAVAFQLFDHSHPPLLGRRRFGRVRDELPALGAWLIDFGQGQSGFLKKKDAPPGLTLGSRLLTEVIREPLGDKAPRLTARPVELGEAPAPPAVISLIERLNPDQLALDGPGLAALRPWLGQRPVEPLAGTVPLFTREEIEESFAAALDPVVPLHPSGRLIIAETPALTAIDIDSGNPADAGALIVAAATATAAEIRRRNLHGQIVIDFPANPPGWSAADWRAKARQALSAALRLDPQQPQLLRGDLEGLVAVTRSRQGDSLWQSVSEPCPVAPGRWLSRRHLAAELMRATEAAARAAPGRPLRAEVPGDVLAWLETAPAGFADWANRLGARLQIAAGPPLCRQVTVTT